MVYGVGAAGLWHRSAPEDGAVAILDQLVAEMETERRKWALSTRLYGTINPGVRVFLIVASSVVAVESRLNGSPGEFLVTWVPVLALAISVMTAIDSWLKPRDKWRGFMTDRDDLSDLIVRARSSPTDNPTTLDRLRADFATLRRRHREKNVY